VQQPPDPNFFNQGYYRLKNIIGSFKPDLVFITGDRGEMCAAAATVPLITYGRPG
jgi:hypothetical protein